jgi:hypothetical protein
VGRHGRSHVSLRQHLRPSRSTDRRHSGSVEGGTTKACEQAAARFVASLGDALSNVTVTCRRTATTAAATVTGTSLSLLPGWAPTITQTVAVPVERVS